jgi:hypothetical protein
MPAVEDGLPEPPPPSEGVSFDWIMAKWELSRPGRWVQDTSGRDHHGLVPAEGVRGTFGGLEFIGTTGVVEIPDHPDFALQAPFTVQGQVKVLTFANERGILLRRGDRSGQEAFALETRPGGLLRFSVTQKDGQRVFIEGKLPEKENRQLHMIHATLDERGKLLLYAGCELVAQGRMNGSPLMGLDPTQQPVVSLGGQKGHRHGFHGEIWSLELMRGVMERTEGSNCGFSLRMAR